MTIWIPELSGLSGPRYKAIADALEADIKSGKLTPGTKLPTHRELADRLDVTVGTITRGYAEAARRGLLRGETGRGTFVGPAADKRLLCHQENISPSLVNMRVSLPFEHLAPDIGATLQAMGSDLSVQSLLEYFPSEGRLVDREAGVEWLRRYNLESCAEDIALTVGGQNALAVVLSAIFRPGDALAVEGITYPLIKALANRFNIPLLPVKQDEFGMIPDSLDEVCRNNTVRGVYLMPTYQNPTTARLPEYRRHEIVNIARRYDLSILEDDAYALPAGDLGTPLATLAPERTFFVASLSKSLAGGLRVAYLHFPNRFANAIKSAIADLVWMTPPLTAEIARRWIMDGTADRTLAIKRKAASQCAEMARTLLAGLDVTMPKSGYYAWLKLPEPWTARDFAREARKHDVLVNTDDVFVVGRQPLPHAIRLGLSGATTMDDLERGLRTVRTILTPR